MYIYMYIIIYIIIYIDVHKFIICIDVFKFIHRKMYCKTKPYRYMYFYT